MAGTTNGVGGSVVNTGMYLMTTDPQEWSARNIAAQASGGFVTGSLGAQAGPLARTAGGRAAAYVQLGVGSGSGIGGGYVSHAMTNQSYSPLEMLVDAGTGAASSKFPEARDLGDPHSLGNHAGIAYGGAHMSMSMSALKFAADKTGENFGVDLWNG